MTTKNATNEKQHYVPEVVLSVFAEGVGKEKLCVFDKHTGRTFPGPTAVSKLCKESGFYTAVTSHGQVSLEATFHQLEREYREIAGKVIAARSLACLSPREFGSLVNFVCVQFLRVPRLREAFDQMARLFADKARTIVPQATIPREFEMDDNELRLRHLEAIAQGTLEGSRTLSRYAWFVMEADPAQLWLSDCPVVMHNDEKSIYAGLGYASPGVQIYFPLTPGLMLVCWHPLVAGRFMQERDTNKRLLGQMKLEYAVGLLGNKATLRASIDKMQTALNAIEQICAAIGSGGSVRATADNVLHFNWLQFQWSYRFILCAEGAFDMASKMLREHPKLKTGIAVGAS